MTLIPRLRLGNYGNGTIGLKASLPGFDVTVLADDNDGDKRSFNSQWTDITKVALIGYVNATSIGTYNVPHGLGYMPHFNAHVYAPASKQFADDGWTTLSSQSGNRINTDLTTSNLVFWITSPTWAGPYSYVIWKVSL